MKKRRAFLLAMALLLAVGCGEQGLQSVEVTEAAVSVTPLQPVEIKSIEKAQDLSRWYAHAKLAETKQYLEGVQAEKVAAQKRAERAEREKRATTVVAVSTPEIAAVSGDFCRQQRQPKARLTVSEAHGCWDWLLTKYSWNQSTAFSKMYCESGGNPWAYNASGATGLMQILTKDRDGNNLGSFDPETNMAQAWEKYESAGGWSPWAC